MALLSNIDLILNPNAASLSNFVSSLTNFDQCVAEADSFPNAFFFRKLCRALASVNAEGKLWEVAAICCMTEMRSFANPFVN